LKQQVISSSVGESKASMFSDEDSDEDLMPTHRPNYNKYSNAESPALLPSKYTFSQSPSDYNRKGDKEDAVGGGIVMSDEDEEPKPCRVSEGKGIRNSVAISLVESVLHNDDRDLMAEESYYVVEYESDD
jgi:hypothetical protein